MNAACRPADEPGIRAFLDEQTPTGGADRVFLTVVTQKTLDLALALVRDGGTIILFTSATDPQAMVDPTALYFRELNLVTSYSPALSDLKDAAETVFERRIDVRPLVTHHLDLARINDAVALYQSGQAIKVLITSGGAVS